MGHEVTVISCEKERNSKASINLEEAVDWTSLKFGARGPMAGAMRALRIALKIPQADVFHARGDLASLSLVISGKKPFLWDVRGLWVDQKMVIGSLPKHRLVKWMGLRIESVAASHSAAITTLTKRVMDPLRNRQVHLPQIWEVIPTCVDLERFTFHQSISEKRHVLLSGVFNQYYDLEFTENILNALEGSGFRISWHRGKESVTPRLKVSGMRIFESKYIEMPKVISNSSMGIAICKSEVGESLKGVMPTKVAEFFSVGRPVLVSPGIGDLDEIITRHRVGWVVDSKTNLYELVDEIKSLLEDPKLPKRCREVAETYFDMSKAAGTYESIYKRMLRI